jgi:glucosyl-dolichyl phosphate glucuronosyltransferase
MHKMSRGKLDVSVIICTYASERWDDLAASVDSVRHQSLSPYEIIVVVDHNPAMFEKARRSLCPAVIVENNGEKGTSGARNAGLKVARGRMIAFLDDDAVAGTYWLERLCKWCEQPGVLGAGGKIVPNWLEPRPGWFPEEFGWVLGYSYTGLPGQAAPVRNLIGSSMVFNRTVFETVGGFRTDIGRVGRKPVGCEETELCIRARQRWPESQFMYEPDALIWHRTPASRATWAYFVARCYSEGLSKAKVTGFVGAKDGLSSERSYTLRVLPTGFVKSLGQSLGHGEHRGQALARAAAIFTGLACTTAGYLAGKIDSLARGWGLRSALHKKKPIAEEVAG